MRPAEPYFAANLPIALRTSKHLGILSMIRHCELQRTKVVLSELSGRQAGVWEFQLKFMLKDWIKWAVRIIAPCYWYLDYLEALFLALPVSEL